jgi:hypothetical protein
MIYNEENKKMKKRIYNKDNNKKIVANNVSSNGRSAMETLMKTQNRNNIEIKTSKFEPIDAMDC